MSRTPPRRTTSKTTTSRTSLRDINGIIASYEGALTELARKYEGRNGTDLDDLVQEGRISIWMAVERGITPSLEVVEFRMRDVVRWHGRRNPVPYEQMLPIEGLPGEVNPVEIQLARDDEPVPD